MFDRIAGVYDRMNGVMTAGLHHQWRRRAAEWRGSRPVPARSTSRRARGPGVRAGSACRPGGSVIGADFSEAMLALARDKTAVAGVAASVVFEQANALALPYRDGEFDAATVGFGARNFSDLQRGLAEMTRVVRPGGRVVVLEITTPTRPPLSTFLELWFDHLVPALGKLAGDPEAYTYLPSSVRRFPPPPELAAVMWDCGLRDVGYVLTAGGIIALHSGTVPA